MKLRAIMALKLEDEFLYKNEPVTVFWRDYAVETSHGNSIEHFAVAFRNEIGEEVCLRSMHPKPEILELPDYQPASKK
jgi:hypothetical protein